MAFGIGLSVERLVTTSTNQPLVPSSVSAHSPIHVKGVGFDKVNSGEATIDLMLKAGEHALPGPCGDVTILVLPQTAVSAEVHFSRGEDTSLHLTRSSIVLSRPVKVTDIASAFSSQDDDVVSDIRNTLIDTFSSVYITGFDVLDEVNVVPKGYFLVCGIFKKDLSEFMIKHPSKTRIFDAQLLSEWLKRYHTCARPAEIVVKAKIDPIQLNIERDSLQVSTDISSSHLLLVGNLDAEPNGDINIEARSNACCWSSRELALNYSGQLQIENAMASLLPHLQMFLDVKSQGNFTSACVFVDGVQVVKHQLKIGLEAQIHSSIDDVSATCHEAKVAVDVQSDVFNRELHFEVQKKGNTTVVLE